MLEIVVLIAIIVLMVRIAGMENQSPWLWGAITFGICILCMAIPIPFARLLIAAVASFGAMTAYKMMRNE